MKTSRVATWLRSLFSLLFVFSSHAVLDASKATAAPRRIDILIVGDIRNDPVEGFKDGMASLGYKERDQLVYKVVDAGGDRAKLASLAQTIVDGKPDVAVAAGGIEADALKEASENTDIPVVFLAVASSVDRGLVDSMRKPGGNLTGVDTNDDQLTAKRIWLISKMFPDAGKIAVVNIPSIKPSQKGLDIAKKTALDLGLQINAVEGNDVEELGKAAERIDRENTDVIYMGLAAPAWQIEKEVFFPISLKHKIPIMGINRACMKRGATVSYSCSRYEAGKQAARLAQKILNGVPPANIPVETPRNMELLINDHVVELLGIEFPPKVWKLADEVVSEKIQP